MRAPTQNWFAGCFTRQDITSRYRQLARQHHPDRGGSHAVMVAINAAYERAKADPAYMNGGRRRPRPEEQKRQGVPTVSRREEPQRPPQRAAHAPEFTVFTYPYVLQAAMACPLCHHRWFMRTKDGWYEGCASCNCFIREVDPVVRDAWVTEMKQAREREEALRRERREERRRRRQEREVWLKTPEGQAETARMIHDSCRNCGASHEVWRPSLDPRFELCPQCRAPRTKTAEGV